MGTHQSIRKTVTPEIPDKLYFRIGDVARLCEVPAYVLRFWETEFPQLKPNKGGTGQRLYRRRDVEMALRIKSLLYDQGYTIPGARQVFKNEAKAREGVVPFEGAAAPALAPVDAPTPAAPSHSKAPERSNIEARLRVLRKEMQELAALLGSQAGKPAASAVAATPNPKPLRPRLVTEPRTAPPKAQSRPPLPPDPRLAKHEARLSERRQGDLFPIE